MPQTNTETRLIGVIRAENGAVASSPSATLHEDLGLDSMDMIELFIAVENHFGIEISDEESDPITFNEGDTNPTVADLARLVDGKLVAKAEG